MNVEKVLYTFFLKSQKTQKTHHYHTIPILGLGFLVVGSNN